MRVLLSGYYGYGNLGDEALLSGLSGGLRALGAEVCVLSGDPAGTRALHGVAAASRYRGVPAALWRSDALVSGGGGLLQDASSSRSLSYYLTLLRLARRLGKRTCVYAQSVGPLSDGGRRRVARALRGVPVAVRDAASQALLRELGVASALVADPALLLACPPPAEREPAGEVRPVLLIPRGGHPDLNEALAGAGRRLLERGVPVCVLGLHAVEDGAEVARLAAALRVDAWYATTPADAMRLTATARYVLSVRLHGLIFAAACGVGFAGLVYDPKVAGFLEEARAPAFERPVEPASLADVASRGEAPDAEAIGRLTDRARRGLSWLGACLTGTTAVQEHTSG